MKNLICIALTDSRSCNFNDKTYINENGYLVADVSSFVFYEIICPKPTPHTLSRLRPYNTKTH